MRIRDVDDPDAAGVMRLLAQLGYPTDEVTILRRLECIRSSQSDRLFVAELDREVAKRLQ